MPDIDGELLDQLEQKLLTAVGQENAITSGELAREVTGETAEANPKTREAVKELLRERSLPVVGSNDGYYIPTSSGPIEDEIESLEGRISGIRERQHLLREAWADWCQTERYDDHDGGGGGRDDASDDHPTSDEQAQQDQHTLSEEERERIKEDPVLSLSDFGAQEVATDGGEA